MKQMARIINKDIINDKYINTHYNYNGIKVPRVTSIISKCIHSDVLMYWANSLGFKHKSYKKTLEASADIGSECHNSIDIFLDSNYTTIKNPENYNANNAFNSFLKWWNDINANNIVEVIFHEHPLICRYFGGTLDGLYRINGKIYLVDYKTSNHVTFNYFLQAAAYRYILRTEFGIELDGIIILQLSKNDISYNEFFLDLHIVFNLSYINSCETCFLSLVYSYYNILKVENEFKLIDW